MEKEADIEHIFIPKFIHKFIPKKLTHIRFTRAQSHLSSVKLSIATTQLAFLMDWIELEHFYDMHGKLLLGTCGRQTNSPPKMSMSLSLETKYIVYIFIKGN